MADEHSSKRSKHGHTTLADALTVPEEDIARVAKKQELVRQSQDEIINKKNCIKEFLVAVEQAAELHPGRKSYQLHVDYLRNFIEKSPDNKLRASLVIAVIGDTGVGKTTLLHAILGPELLPASSSMDAVTPCAITINPRDEKIHHSKFTAEIHFLTEAETLHEICSVRTMKAAENDSNAGDEADRDMSNNAIAQKWARLLPNLSDDQWMSTSAHDIMSELDEVILNRIGHTMSLTSDDAKEFKKELANLIRKEITSIDDDDEDLNNCVISMASHIEVFIDSEALKPGMVYCDLPGLADANEARTAHTENWLQKADLVLLLVEGVKRAAVKGCFATYLNRLLPVQGKDIYSSDRLIVVSTQTDSFKMKDFLNSYPDYDGSYSAEDMQKARENVNQASAEENKRQQAVSDAEAEAKKKHGIKKAWRGRLRNVKAGKKSYPFVINADGSAGGRLSGAPALSQDEIEDELESSDKIWKEAKTFVQSCKNRREKAIKAREDAVLELRRTQANDEQSLMLANHELVIKQLSKFADKEIHKYIARLPESAQYTAEKFMPKVVGVSAQKHLALLSKEETFDSRFTSLECTGIGMLQHYIDDSALSLLQKKLDTIKAQLQTAITAIWVFLTEHRIEDRLSDEQLESNLQKMLQVLEMTNDETLTRAAIKSLQPVRAHIQHHILSNANMTLFKSDLRNAFVVHLHNCKKSSYQDSYGQGLYFGELKTLFRHGGKWAAGSMQSKATLGDRYEKIFLLEIKKYLDENSIEEISEVVDGIEQGQKEVKELYFALLHSITSSKLCGLSTRVQLSSHRNSTTKVVDSAFDLLAKSLEHLVSVVFVMTKYELESDFKDFCLANFAGLQGTGAVARTIAALASAIPDLVDKHVDNFVELLMSHFDTLMSEAFEDLSLEMAALRQIGLQLAAKKDSGLTQHTFDNPKFKKMEGRLINSGWVNESPSEHLDVVTQEILTDESEQDIDLLVLLTDLQVPESEQGENDATAAQAARPNSEEI